jgi:hypothetical protein
MPKNKTLYVKDEDVPVWKEAKRLLAFYHGKTLSTFIGEQLRKYIAEETARQAKKK